MSLKPQLERIRAQQSQWNSPWSRASLGKSYSKRQKTLSAMTKGNADDRNDSTIFKIASESVVYDRYMTVYNRRVEFPRQEKNSNGLTTSTGVESHEFDVVGHPKASFHFCISFPYHPPKNTSDHWSEGEVTLIKEYAQGPNALVYGLPAGSFHKESHKTLEGCAMAELSEEAHLCGGSIHRLLDEDCPGIPEVKWCCNRFTPFIVFDPKQDEDPGHRDSEEYIEIKRMKIRDVKKMLHSGNLLLPSVTTCYWAFEWLEEHYNGALQKQST